MEKRYTVELTDGQRQQLCTRLAKDALTQRQRCRLEILLRSDAGDGDEAIADAVGTSLSTIHRTRQRFVREGFDVALTERRRPGQPRKLDGKQEALLVALACSIAPEGQTRWTARLLRNRLVELEVVESLSEDTIRRVLKKMRSNRGRSARGACRS